MQLKDSYILTKNWKIEVTEKVLLSMVILFNSLLI